jgi:hypothetical protein
MWHKKPEREILKQKLRVEYSGRIISPNTAYETYNDMQRYAHRCFRRSGFEAILKHRVAFECLF